MANATDIKYGAPPSGSNTVDWLPTEDHLHVVSLSGSIDRMMTITRVVSGADLEISAPVLLNDNGTCSYGGKVPDDIESGASWSLSSQRMAITYNPTDNKYVLLYDSNGTYARTGTYVPSAGDITWGIENRWATVSSTNIRDLIYDPDSGNMVCWSAYSNLGGVKLYLNVCNIIPHATDPSQDSLSFGTQYTMDSDITYSTWYSVGACHDPVNNRIILVQGYNDATNRSLVEGITITGTSITTDYSVSYITATTSGIYVDYYPPEDRVIFVYNSTNTYSHVCSAGASTISIASSDTIEAPAVTTCDLRYDPVNQNMLLLTLTGNVLYARHGVVNAGTEDITWGTSVDLGLTDVNRARMIFDSSVNVFAITYQNTSGQHGYMVIDTSTDPISVIGTPTILDSSNGSDNLYPPIGYDPDNEKTTIISANNIVDTVYPYIVDINTITDITTEQWIGFCQTDSPSGTNAVIGRYGFLDQNQSGMTPGNTYYLDSDGNLTTSSTNTVLAGLAITNTALLIKG